MQQENNKKLSDVWHQLLGDSLNEPQTLPTAANFAETVIPTLESDPWSELIQAKGIEVVDLHQLHLHMSDLDVEEALYNLQEQSAQDPTIK